MKKCTKIVEEKQKIRKLELHAENFEELELKAEHLNEHRAVLS